MTRSTTRNARRAVAGRDRLDQVVEQRGLRVPEQRRGALVLELAPAGAGDELVEHGERVADRPAARADHQRQHARRHGHALAVAELLQVRHQHVGRDQPERVVVRAGADGADDLVRLGRREDELDVRRRLLDDLEQRVEALVRDHVRLVEDEDLVPVARGRERGALAQLAGVVDAAVAGRVDLDDVEAARSPARQLDARRAHAARGVGGVPSVFCAQLRMRARMRARRRLAAAARAGEQVRVVDLTAAQRLPQGRGDVVLTDHLGEVLRPVAAVQGCRHATNPRRPRRQSRAAAPGGLLSRRGTTVSRQHRPQQRPRRLASPRTPARTRRPGTRPAAGAPRRRARRPCRTAGRT